jgi:hypothetical protein
VLLTVPDGEGVAVPLELLVAEAEGVHDAVAVPDDVDVEL